MMGDAMKNLSEYTSETLKIIRPRIGGKYYELRSENELLCTMQFPGFFRRTAVVNYNDQQWTIQKEKWWNRTLIVSEHFNEIICAKVYLKYFRRSIVELPKGEKYIIKFGLFRNPIVITTELESPVAIIKRKFGFVNQCDVNIERSAKNLDEYPWLIMLAWYIDLRRRHNRAGTH
jgi:hypothetical protein